MDKYIVTKSEDWEQWAKGPQPTIGPSPLDDAVVIRLKDPFAATALYTYANTILSFVELMRMTDHLNYEDENRLMDIADYFQSQADRSHAITKKRLPD